MSVVKTVHVGLGPIGLKIARATLHSGFAQPVAAADVSPELVGKSLGELVESTEGTEVVVLDSLEAALAAGKAAGAQVLVLATGSKLPAIASQLRAAIEAGLNVVSTSEELSWPWLRNPDLANELDALAKQHGVTLVGTGINPGFLLDLLPLLLCRPCVGVRKITAKRIVNVSARRQQLQKKIGSGLDPETYRALAAKEQIGHVGLGESAAFLAAGLGWEHEDIYETIEPVIATEPCGTEYFQIQPGQVKGSHQVARISTDDGKCIELICRMTHGEPDPRDEVFVEGEPYVHMRIEGGIFGDTATVGCVLNILRQTVNAVPGLLTVKDIPVG
ncbi:dihydrodipicolinate reductase [bacterium]|nr:dihydrodipicolinate reductase [bacterium]